MEAESAEWQSLCDRLVDHVADLEAELATVQVLICLSLLFIVCLIDLSKWPSHFPIILPHHVGGGEPRHLGGVDGTGG